MGPRLSLTNRRVALVADEAAEASLETRKLWAEIHELRAALIALKDEVKLKKDKD